MNNVTRDHTPFARMLTCDPKHVRIINITHAQSTCMHVHVRTVQLLIVDNESSLIVSQLPTCQHQSRRQAKQTITRAVWYYTNSPPHMQPHKPHLCS